jgi:hypothetical protein
MCGLLGVIAAEGKCVDASDVKQLLHIGELAQRRGVDASGLILIGDDVGLQVVKANQGFTTMIKSEEAKALLQKAKSGTTFGLFGHSRLETHGYSGDSKNNQPVVIGNWVVVHNGVITNAKELRESINNRDGGIETDSVAIALLLQEWDDGGRQEDSEEVFSRLRGEYSVIAVSHLGEVICRSNVGNLYSASGKDGQVFLGSEPRQFPKELRDICQQLPRDTTITLRSSGTEEMKVTVKDTSRKSAGMEGAQGLHIQSSEVNVQFSRRMEKVAHQAQDHAAGLRRCTCCVLPETFPGISFDATGRCSICASFQTPNYAGLDQLKNDLSKKLTPNGEVLVCLSGGRDSCYVMHLIHQLGFKIVAYTYDWGMVTTAARENMSRMCGDLGVEHVLVSPDIRQNRIRINRALQAWLKKPKLGTIPILMAGDKPYFRWGRDVALERGGIPAVLADHPMETTGFKSMLAGAKFSPDSSGGVSYRLTPTSMLRMSAVYGGHALQSPGLFPALLKEGFTGFVDYYLRKHDFFRPFSYIPWEEEEIERVLRAQYDWSSGPDHLVSSWRMGDGTAPFYNLMYLLGLGLTEHDTLRSNQIRYGLMERSEAMKKLTSDNRFNVLGLASYFATVGIDLEWAGDRISEFAKVCLEESTG